MDTANLVDFHLQGIEDYARFWRAQTLVGEKSMSNPEAAYHFLKSLGMVYRYTANHDFMKEFCAFPVGDRIALVEDACTYALQATWKQQIEDLYSEDCMDDEDVEQLEGLLTQRDALNVTVGTCRSLSNDLLSTQPGLVSLLARVITIEDDLDHTFLCRPEALMEAVTIMDEIRKHVAIPFDLRRQWWFCTPEQFSEAIEVGLAEAVEMYAMTRREAQPPIPAATTVDKPASLSLVARIKQALAPYFKDIGEQFSWWNQPELGFAFQAEAPGAQAGYVTGALMRHPALGVRIDPAFDVAGVRIEFDFGGHSPLAAAFVGASLVLQCGDAEIARSAIDDQGCATIPLLRTTPVDAIVILGQDGSVLDQFRGVRYP